MITATIVGDRALIERIQSITPSIRQRLEQTVRGLGLQLENRVKTQKLQGQVLHQRSGRLNRSVNTKLESGTTKITATVGAYAPYAAAWEFGFTARIGAGARGGPHGLSAAALARYYSKHPPGEKHYAARSFLRSSLAEMAEQIRLEIAAAAQDAASKALKP